MRIQGTLRMIKWGILKEAFQIQNCFYGQRTESSESGCIWDTTVGNMVNGNYVHVQGKEKCKQI